MHIKIVGAVLSLTKAKTCLLGASQQLQVMGF